MLLSAHIVKSLFLRRSVLSSGATSRIFMKTQNDSKNYSSIFKEDGVTLDIAHKRGSQWLSNNGVDDGEDSSRHLLTHAMRATIAGKSTYPTFSDFVRHRSTKLSTEEINTYESYLHRRITREPVQYIIGEWDFYGMTLRCRPPTLIPRPETEELVEHILKSIQSLGAEKEKKSIRILDVGAGTGAIGLAFLTHSTLPLDVTAIDISPSAVSLSQENANILLSSNLRPNYKCIYSSLEDFGLNKTSFGLFDIIVSNPPYIPTAELTSLMPDVKNFEDKVALDGGTDGLAIVRELLRISPLLMNPQGAGEMWLEVSSEHPAMLEQHFPKDSPKNKGWGFVSSFKDLFGKPRFVKLKYRY